MLIANNATITTEADALLLFAAAVSQGESGHLCPGELLALKSVILNDLDISDHLTPNTVRLLCCGNYWFTEPDWRTYEGDFLAPWRFERVNGDITVDNIDTP